MGSLDRQRWDALWQRLGGNPPADAFDALLAAYGGPTGTTTAIATSSPAWSTSTAGANWRCGRTWWSWRCGPTTWSTTPAPGQRGRQRRQHRALARPGRAGGAGPLRELIMATCHQAPPGDADAALVVDIDLAILAAPAPVYARYEADVRAEYAWVPEPLFRAGRGSCCASCWSNRRCTTANRCGNAGGRRPRQPARCPGAPGTAGLSRTGKFLRAA